MRYLYALVIALAIGIALSFATIARADDAPPVVPPDAFTVQVTPSLSLHPMVAVPMVAFDLSHDVVQGAFAPGALYELDYEGKYGVAAGGSLIVSGSTFSLSATVVGTLHLPQLAGTPISHVVLGYSRSLVGGPYTNLLVVGPAFQF